MSLGDWRPLPLTYRSHWSLLLTNCFCRPSPVQGEQVRPGDVQAVHLQLPHHLLCHFLLELPQDVGWLDVQQQPQSAAAFSLLVMLVISAERWTSFML